jgi:hypothetical protein
LVDRAWFQRLKLEYDQLLSNFAFNVNLRRYTTVNEVVSESALIKRQQREIEAGRCSLTLSNLR